MPGRSTPSSRSLRVHVAAVGAVLALAAGVGALAANADIAGAVVASGSLVVESNIKKVQHPTGGVVSRITVHDGSRVEAGELLLLLDATSAKANLSAVSKSLYELAARQARLEANRDGAEEPLFPPELLAAGADPEIGRILSGERALFQFEREALDGQVAQLRERVNQLREEINGLLEQTRSKGQELELVEREHAGVYELWQKNLIQLTRVTALEREQARLKGERGALMAQTAQTRGRIAETELQVIQLRQTRRTDVAKELAEIRAKVATLTEQKVMAQDQISRIEIRAPQTGYVHELSVHGPGAVLSAGETILTIIPSSDALVVELRIAPQDIAQVRIGQSATIRFPSFDQRTTPELRAEVSRVSPDVTEDKRSGAYYFLVRLRLRREEVSRLGEAKLVPGMPADAFIKTQDRSILSYLMKPLSDQAARALRER